MVLALGIGQDRSSQKVIRGGHESLDVSNEILPWEAIEAHSSRMLGLSRLS